MCILQVNPDDNQIIFDHNFLSPFFFWLLTISVAITMDHVAAVVRVVLKMAATPTAAEPIETEMRIGGEFYLGHCNDFSLPISRPNCFTEFD